MSRPKTRPYNTDNCHLSAKYTEYIKIHLEDLQSKCNDLTVCINELLSQQNPIAVLQGDDLGLDKICELINVKGNSTNTMLDGKCSLNERIDIMKDVENHIKEKIEKKDTWEGLAVCLDNSYGDPERTTYVGDICGLLERDKVVCRPRIHNQVEKYINEQIEHLQCTCKALNSPETGEEEKLSTAHMVSMGVGALLLLVIIFGLVFFCWKRKQRKRKKKKQGPNVIYLPAAHSENYPVYQEIFDQRSPPSVPSSSRYRSRPLPGHPVEDTEYLEPVQAQASSSSYRAKAPTPLDRLVNNPGYNVDDPPEYSETDRMYEDAIAINPELENAYIDPIVTPKEETTGGYDTLNARATETENPSAPNVYQPLEGIDADEKLGPSPSQRTKKEDRTTESEYFELEKVATV